MEFKNVLIAMDFWQGAGRMKYPECIQDTSGFQVERQHRQKFK